MFVGDCDGGCCWTLGLLPEPLAEPFPPLFLPLFPPLPGDTLGAAELPVSKVSVWNVSELPGFALVIDPAVVCVVTEDSCPPLLLPLLVVSDCGGDPGEVVVDSFVGV